MSSLRNAVHRRQHRERGQLDSRAKWGLLEKHKDYSLRAKDYNLKKQKLARLREKAHDRNPDEFAFGMLSETNSRQGKHGARDSQASSLSQETVKLLKTQDAGYLRTVGERIRREVERLEQEVQLQDGMAQVLSSGRDQTGHGSGDDDDFDDGFDDDLFAGAKRRKIIFADSREDQKNKLGSLLQDSEDEEMNDDDEEDNEADDSFGKRQQQQQQNQKQPSKKQLEAERQALIEERAARKRKQRAAQGRVKKLEALKKQYAAISKAERELELQRARMTNSIGGVNKNGVKWKVRERKR